MKKKEREKKREAERQRSSQFFSVYIVYLCVFCEVIINMSSTQGFQNRESKKKIKRQREREREQKRDRERKRERLNLVLIETRLPHFHSRVCSDVNERVGYCYYYYISR